MPQRLFINAMAQARYEIESDPTAQGFDLLIGLC